MQDELQHLTIGGGIQVRIPEIPSAPAYQRADVRSILSTEQRCSHLDQNQSNSGLPPLLLRGGEHRVEGKAVQDEVVRCISLNINVPVGGCRHVLCGLKDGVRIAVDIDKLCFWKELKEQVYPAGVHWAFQQDPLLPSSHCELL